ncbi:hypothetical protein U9M48_002074 [Paspalum notatum var. saurae]|uniref:F-box domain-containing protein n=1 Tax=Paspalum notatum var. saurae TaxID=547442 RepID=A0AAQ3PN82_PASNO
MAQDHCRHRRRRRRLSVSVSGEDRISGLPDELLHAILGRLECARAAAPTTVLSRRWRPVYAHLPELFFTASWEPSSPSPATSFLDTIDVALAAHSAPALQHLSIELSTDDCRRNLTPGRVAPWLQFASQRVVGKLVLALPNPRTQDQAELELPLPAFGAAETITLVLDGAWRLRLQQPPPDGVFAALTSLTIRPGRVDGGELTALSVHSLCFDAIGARRLEVVTPRLDTLTVYYAMDALISSPKLGEVSWHVGSFDPLYHRFQDTSRRLRRLEIGPESESLLQQFDEIDKLNIEICIPRMHDCWLESCPCRLEGSHMFYDVALNSLEEVEINSYTSPREVLQFVERLSKCDAPVLKKVVIDHRTDSAPPPTKEECQNIRNMYHPNIEVEFYESSNVVRVQLETA